MNSVIKIIVCFVFAGNLLHAQTSFQERLSCVAIELTTQHVVYDASYFSIPYPNGDVPAGRGVCTDVIIRAYRKIGIDLQREVHEDMSVAFNQYPNRWGLKHPDHNIDHRRVPNLMIFFMRHGMVKKISDNAADYVPGDIVCWNIGRGVVHIGIVVNRKSADGERFLIVHNIGAGQVMEDCLFRFEITGHYVYNRVGGCSKKIVIAGLTRNPLK